MRKQPLQFLACSFLLFLGVLLGQSPALSQQPASSPLVVGHRGLMHQAPECTLAAFRACLALRVGFEFDVRRTKDGQLVCLHDPTLDRTTDGRGSLVDFTLDQVQKLDAGSRFAPQFKEEHIPRIDEIFALAAQEGRGDHLLAVDLKEAGHGLEEKIVRLAEQHKILDRLLFIGLTIESPQIRASLKTASLKARTACLANSPEEASAILTDSFADWVYLRFLPSPDDMRRIHAAGKRVFIAGPLVAGNESENWKKATALGIDAILTDFPLDLARQLRHPPGP